MELERNRRGLAALGWDLRVARAPGEVGIDLEEVRAALTRDQVVRHFQFPVAGPTSGWWRGHECPACRKRWPRLCGSGFCIGRRGWQCKACGAKGDLLDLVARLAGLDQQHEFRALLSLGADLAGVRPEADPTARTHRRRELDDASRLARLTAAAARQQRRHEARHTAPAVWATQLVDHTRGRAYLEDRGLDVEKLIGRRLVRFCPVGWRPGDEPGDPVVVLHDWDGAILSLARRRIALDEPRTPGLAAHPTDGTLVGHLEQVTSAVDVVIAEGVIDSLTAAIAWPCSVVLGAHGASHVGTVCDAAAPRVKAVGGRLLLVPDTDPPGQRALVDAVRRATDAGLVISHDLVVVDLGDHDDLNAAWCAGWRP